MMLSTLTAVLGTAAPNGVPIPYQLLSTTIVMKNVTTTASMKIEVPTASVER
jgi:hypothetical protein